MSLINNELSKVFGQLAKQYEDLGEVYRSRAYQKAAIGIANYHHPITSGKQAQTIRGVGKSIADKIDEYLQTGKMKIFEEIKQKQSQPTVDIEKENVLKSFQGIYGVGPITAEKWYNQGYRTISDLGNIPMTDAQQLGYKYYYHLLERIPRSEMDLIAQRIDRVMKTIPGIEYMICGSYRRGTLTSGDIDCLIKGNGITLQQAVNKFVDDQFIVGHLAIGATKYLGLCRLDLQHNIRRIDFMIIKPSSWAYGTLYFTGSQQLNILMRNRAIELGLTLNEYGLFKSNGELIPATTEQEIFNHLGLKYLEPHQRSF